MNEEAVEKLGATPTNQYLARSMPALQEELPALMARLHIRARAARLPVRLRLATGLRRRQSVIAGAGAGGLSLPDPRLLPEGRRQVEELRAQYLRARASDVRAARRLAGAAREAKPRA
jgi:predicted metalloendopeptidase